MSNEDPLGTFGIERGDEPCEECRLYVCECDPTPWCNACGARRRENCHCGPIAENE